MTRRSIVLCAFAVLLLASHVWRLRPAELRVPAAPARVLELSELGEDARAGRTVRLVYEDSGADAPAALPVLLLHGSPGGRGDLAALAAGLATRRCIRPDLPGFGDSSRDLADTSIRVHGAYVLALLDALDIQRAHVVGFSMGGGVALELSALARERVASLTLLSSIGVQELELLGDHDLNHVLHGLQLAALWGATELVPHFGALDDAFLGLDYARNFYDSDQRPLRAALLAWDGPVRIVHGEQDPLVPVAAALEHRRVAPQAELELHPEGHFLVFQRADELAANLEGFLERVERGAARTRADLTPEEAARARAPFDARGVPPLSGLALALVLVLAALGTLVSEDLTCIAVGGLVAQGRVPFAAGTAACFAGILLGDVLLFLAGRWIGPRALARPPCSWVIDRERVARARTWLERRGGWVILASRFLPGARLPTYFACGALGTSLVRFTAWFALAGLLWTPGLVGLAALVGGGLERFAVLRENAGWLFLVTLLAAWTALALGQRLSTRRGRALLCSSWRRLVRFEYWPLWAFYAPVAVWMLARALRERRGPLFTAANPALPHGGVVGESKSAIHQELLAAGAPLPATLVLPAGEAPEAARARVEEFRRAHGLGWPLVLKPDAGQRGEGVVLLRGPADLEQRHARGVEDRLLQEHVGGLEFGLMYARRPGAETGAIVSITRKVLPEVVGDGCRTLERLVLEHPEHLPMARFLLASNAAALESVPARGERVVLGSLGTHCRGARFLDGKTLASAELCRRVDAIARGLPGFHLGRFDVRSPSDEDLCAGRFTILELNGVTSEPGHMYDPSFTLLEAWRCLLGHWRLAWEIGAENARHGARVSRWSELVAAQRAYRRLAAARSAAERLDVSERERAARAAPELRGGVA